MAQVLRRIFLIPAMLALLATPALAQLSVRLPGPVGAVLDPVTRTVDGLSRDTLRIANDLARERVREINRLVRRNRDVIELDREGEPARRGELLAMNLSPAALAAAEGAGFVSLGSEAIAGLGLEVTRMRVPAGMTLADAEPLLASLAPDAVLTPDHLHFSAGDAAFVPAGFAARSATISSSVAVGMIDGAPGSAVRVNASKGFAKGAPTPSNHGSAVAALLQHAGVRTIHVADVYGKDPAGGNALAIAKGLGWLVGQGSEVVTISLVGPKNAVLQRAISAAQSRGVVVVAAVGNDGPAAPPAYPASYQGVIAVTAVDRRNRALIEAGRALHLDYAAPGADIRARDATGKLRKLRGTSYATPLAAARVAAALAKGGNWRAHLDSEARDLGQKGPDPVYGRGLLCASCRGE